MRFYVPLLVLTCLASAAHGAAPVSADALIEQGIRLRQKHQYVEALELFQKAHAAAPSAKTFAQIGLTEANLKHWVDAETHLGVALDSHDTPWIENATNREAISQALALVRGHVGLVSVAGPAGAEIAIAGTHVGRLPLPAPIHVAEGRARIEGFADGRQAASVDLRVPGGHELTVHLDLPLLPASMPLAGPSAPGAVLRNSSPSLLEAGGSVPENTSWKTWTGGGLLAVSAGLLTTGIVWVAIDGNGECSPPAGSRCMRVYDTKTRGWIMAGAGAATAVVGGLLLWQGHHSDSRVSLGYGTVMASGTF
jgi:hypothetical protein